MRHELKLHPDSKCSALTRIEADVARSPGGALVLTYFATGIIAGLRLPPMMRPGRADELWKTTCFEAFVRPRPGASYFEFNFAPSTRWAAYRFDDYRKGMARADNVSPSSFEISATGDAYELQASLELDSVPDDSVWSVGLAAVIEEIDGTKSYWALAHPPGKPDFHHPDCFALELPAA